MGIQPLIDSWLAAIPSNLRKSKVIVPTLQRLWNEFLEDSLRFLRRNLKEPSPTCDNNLVQSLQRILDCYLVPYTETDTKKIQPEELEVAEQVIEPLFLFALVWSVGCTTDSDGRVKFSLFLKDLVRAKNVRTQFPEEGDIYEWEYVVEQKQFVLWSQRNANFQIDAKNAYHEIMVPTSDSTRNIQLMKTLMNNSKHVLCPGPTGTGKTLNIFQMLTNELGENF